VQEWVDAGIYDPVAPGAADRLGLLGYLTGLGFSLEDLVTAHGQGRLFALAGDRLIHPAGRELGRAQIAALHGEDADFLDRTWQAFGLPSVDELHLTVDELEVLSVVLTVRDMLGEDATLGLARVVGFALARAAEAANSVLWTGYSDVGLDASGSELATARAYAEVGAVVPAYGRLLAVVHRHHITEARRHFESLSRPPSLAVTCAVGFADVSGFTTLSQQVDLAELSQLLTAFERVGSQVVREHGGRVVKFLGDAVMFVTADAAHLVEVAQALITDARAVSAGLEVRAGGAFGEVLAQDGDYFGTPVNLASRLTGAAGPGELLVDAAVASALEDGRAVAAEPVALRGFAAPVTPWRVLPLP